jgi:primosomal replication protein N
MAQNSVELEGVIFKPPVRTQSPAGMEHCHFVLEHQSQQIEAELPRKAFLRIQVVASGIAAQQSTQDLFPGCVVKVSGFLSQHEARSGLTKLVLHARTIERKN